MKTKDTFAQSSPEQELDDFIDALNLELRPKESTHDDVAELQSLTRNIKNLRPAAEPREQFTRQLQENLRKNSYPGARS